MASQPAPATSTPAPVATTVEESKSTIREIEPLLKWAGVAYGAGFFVVMLHTYRLGVPVVQLIEPIYIWIGLPLAVVLYFIRQLISAFRRTRKTLRSEREVLRREYEELQESSTPPEASQALSRIIVTTAPFLLPIVGVRNDLLISLLQKFAEKQLEKHVDVLSYTRKFASQLLFWAGTIAAVNRFVGRVLTLALIPLACGAYVWWFYPIIPQGLGGGKPSEVRLIVDTKKVPTDDVELRSLFPADVAQKKPNQGKADEKSSEPEGRTTCNVALHYQTEHAYYVQRGTGPIVVIDHDAVEGSVFAAGKADTRQGCT